MLVLVLVLVLVIVAVVILLSERPLPALLANLCPHLPICLMLVAHHLFHVVCLLSQAFAIHPYSVADSDYIQSHTGALQSKSFSLGCRDEGIGCREYVKS